MELNMTSPTRERAYTKTWAGIIKASGFQAQ
jgi:hypothetical protein